ncbi:MAG: hypothetical protein GC149_17650 [Gammaproteobacteria bacterium]|nr:hypothetical protein [Gammaproteobacteria bacterium]
MSRWLPEQIRIILHPTQVVLLRIGRGRAQTIVDKRVVACAPQRTGLPSWQNALTALMSALPDFHNGKSNVTVVLSNHFVRYVLVKHLDQVSSLKEEQALVQHHFTRIYGAAVAQWSLQVSPAQHRNCPRIACAIDRDLIDALRKLLQPTRHVLRSIQPYLMTAFNQYRRYLTASAWLALVEDGVFCLARLEDSCWQTVKCIRTSDDWQNELTIQLEREELLLLGKTPVRERSRTPVFVFAPEYPEPIDVAPELPPEANPNENHVHILDPSLWPKPAQTEEPVHAMALIG